MNFINALSWVNFRFLLDGFKITIEVSLLSIILSFIIGSIVGILRYMNIIFISKFIAIITDIIRNLPLLLIIFFTYFYLPKIGIRLSIFLSVVIALTIFESAMLSEIFRSGLHSVSKGQIEAALSTGLNYFSIMYRIVLPQAFKSMLPAIITQLISLIKDTSLAIIISLPELTHNAKIIYGQNTKYILPMFIVITFMYFIACYSLSLFSVYLENKKYNY